MTQSQSDGLNTGRRGLTDEATCCRSNADLLDGLLLGDVVHHTHHVGLGAETEGHVTEGQVTEGHVTDQTGLGVRAVLINNVDESDPNHGGASTLMISACRTSSVCSVSVRGQRRTSARDDSRQTRAAPGGGYPAPWGCPLTGVVHDVGGHLLWSDVGWDGDLLCPEGHLGEDS